MRHVSTLERFWLAYCACAITAAVIAWPDTGSHCAMFRPGWFVALHLGFAALQVLPPWLQWRGSPHAARVLRAAVALVGVPAVFSAMCMALPHAHPEAFEITWMQFDHALFGVDPTAAMRLSQGEVALAALQVIYAGFYALPICACVLVLLQRGGPAFDQAVAVITGGFLLSYLLYLWFPTLGPKDVAPLPVPPGGVIFAGLHTMLHEAEANHWDCFPSGHTMMSLVGAAVASQHRCKGARWLWVFALAIVVSTLVLRYHWVADVLVGAALAALWLPASRLLLESDASR